MKKTVFALQVIGLITMLPAVVILEMNHVPLHQSTSPEPINTISVLPEKTAGKVSEEAFNISLETLLFKTTW